MPPSTPAPWSRPLAAALLAVAGSLLAASVPRAAADDGDLPSDPVFIARLVDGSTITGRLARLEADGRWVFRIPGQDEPRAVGPDELVSLQRDGASPPALPERSLAVLPDGDRLRADIGRVDEDLLRVQSPCLGPLDLPLSSLLGLILDAPSDLEAQQALIDTLRSEPGGKEVLFLTNGDRVEMAFVGLGTDIIEVDRPSGAVKLPRSGVRAIAFDAKLAEYPKPDRAYQEFTLTDGSRISATASKLESGVLAASSRWGKPIRIPLAEVARIVVRSPVIAYLSDRAEDGANYRPYLGSPRPFRKDLAVDGQPLMLRGQPYDHGLGMQSRTLVAYKLDGSAKRFQARIGLDDRAGQLGSVVFRVRLDRETVFESAPLTEGDAPKDIDLPIGAAQILILEADYGDRGDVRDFADWVDARLIVAPRAKSGGR